MLNGDRVLEIQQEVRGHPNKIQAGDGKDQFYINNTKTRCPPK